MTGTDLQEWATANAPSKEMSYERGYWQQVCFIRDHIGGILSLGCPSSRRGIKGTVISTHRSKSVSLPVVEFTRPDLGLRLIFRNNFYNWKMSVISEKPITADFTGLFIETPPPEPEYTGDHLAACYFEGFPSDLVFGYRSASSTKFSAEIGGDETLAIVLFLLMRSLDQVKPRTYHTKAEHKKALDEETKEWEAERKAAQEKAAAKAEGGKAEEA